MKTTQTRRTKWTSAAAVIAALAWLVPAKANAANPAVLNIDVSVTEVLSVTVNGVASSSVTASWNSSQPNALIVGQDLEAGYIGQDGIHYQLYLSESVVLRIDDPGAACIIPARPALKPANAWETAITWSWKTIVPKVSFSGSSREWCRKGTLKCGSRSSAWRRSM